MAAGESKDKAGKSRMKRKEYEKPLHAGCLSSASATVSIVAGIAKLKPAGNPRRENTPRREVGAILRMGRRHYRAYELRH